MDFSELSKRVNAECDGAEYTARAVMEQGIAEALREAKHDTRYGAQLLTNTIAEYVLNCLAGNKYKD